MQKNHFPYLFTLALVSTFALVTYMNFQVDSSSADSASLDLTCGFSDDFSNFLKSNGTFINKSRIFQLWIR